MKGLGIRYHLECAFQPSIHHLPERSPSFNFPSPCHSALKKFVITPLRTDNKMGLPINGKIFCFMSGVIRNVAFARYEAN
jgi:hypothetical protein